MPGWLPQVSAFTVFLGTAGVGFLFLLVSLVFGEIFEQVGEELDHGAPGAARLARTGPSVVFSLLQQLEALELSIPAVLEQLAAKPEAGKGGPVEVEQQKG